MPESMRGAETVRRKEKKLWEIAYNCLARLMKPNVELGPNLNFLSNAFLYAKVPARTLPTRESLSKTLINHSSAPIFMNFMCQRTREILFK